MTIRNLKTDQSGSRDKKKEAAAEEAGHGDSCRCKETSKMMPQELFKLMVNDLAVWKKAQKEGPSIRSKKQSDTASRPRMCDLS